jgi:hypothetical protein
VHPDDRGHSGVIEPAGLGQGRLQQAELSGGDLDTLADALGEPASLADGTPVLLTLAAHPAEHRAPRAWRRAGFAQPGPGRAPNRDLPFPLLHQPDYPPSPLPLSGLLGLAPRNRGLSNNGTVSGDTGLKTAGLPPLAVWMLVRRMIG